MDIQAKKKQNIDHLNRIAGQLQTLKSYIEEGRSCQDISNLSTSIAKSFDTLRIRTVEGFVLNDLLKGQKINDDQLTTLQNLLQLHKK